MKKYKTNSMFKRLDDSFMSVFITLITIPLSIGVLYVKEK